MLLPPVCCWLQRGSKTVLLPLAPDCLSKVVGGLCVQAHPPVLAAQSGLCGPAHLGLTEDSQLFVRSDLPVMASRPTNYGVRAHPFRHPDAAWVWAFKVEGLRAFQQLLSPFKPPVLFLCPSVTRLGWASTPPGAAKSQAHREDRPPVVVSPTLLLFWACKAPFTLPHFADSASTRVEAMGRRKSMLILNPVHCHQNSSLPLLILDIGLCGHHLQPFQNPTGLGHLCNEFMKRAF
ncbi:uncharacterized protein LOC113920445 [Zalophus californianus]|uniref:Uncharacterized protein LOC113920445 n=1 Tax=Zalophus californianus TaxID=9704 RepID=A0A6J2CQ88_ZALCA|nr:uncharacterized protein LOC113920445 [Zalophus californianus]